MREKRTLGQNEDQGVWGLMKSMGASVASLISNKEDATELQIICHDKIPTSIATIKEACDDII
jgi:hypothetical protein